MTQETGAIQIRKLIESDLISIDEIEQQMFAMEKRTLPFPFQMYWKRYQPNINFVADLNGKAVGFICGKIKQRVDKASDEKIGGVEKSYLPDEQVGWVDMLGTHPEHHHKGITKALMARFYQECNQYGLKMRVVVYKNDDKLENLMLNTGFWTFKIDIYERE